MAENKKEDLRTMPPPVRGAPGMVTTTNKRGKNDTL